MEKLKKYNAGFTILGAICSMAAVTVMGLGITKISRQQNFLSNKIEKKVEKMQVGSKVISVLKSADACSETFSFLKTQSVKNDHDISSVKNRDGVTVYTVGQKYSGSKLVAIKYKFINLTNMDDMPAGKVLGDSEKTGDFTKRASAKLILTFFDEFKKSNFDKTVKLSLSVNADDRMTDCLVSTGKVDAAFVYEAKANACENMGAYYNTQTNKCEMTGNNNALLIKKMSCELLGATYRNGRCSTIKTNGTLTLKKSLVLGASRCKRNENGKIYFSNNQLMTCVDGKPIPLYLSKDLKRD